MIARTFYRRGSIETLGRGTSKIARLMQAAGHRPSAVPLREGAVVLTLRLPGKTPGKRQGNARVIRILRDSGLLVRVGPDKGGQWKVEVER